MHAMIWRKKLQNIDEVIVIGDPIAACVAFTFKTLNPYSVAEALKDTGNWNIGMLQFPKAIQFLMAQRFVDELGMFIDDLKIAMQKVKNDPKKYEKGFAAIYGAACAMPDRSLVVDSCNTYLEVMSTPLDFLQS